MFVWMGGVLWLMTYERLLTTDSGHSCSSEWDERCLIANEGCANAASCEFEEGFR